MTDEHLGTHFACGRRPERRGADTDGLDEYHLANEVVVATDGEEALDYLYYRGRYAQRDRENPAVLLLDLKLPKVDGLEVLKQIKSDGQLKLIPVVVLTSSREEKDMVASYQLGVNAYVVKPVEFHEFVNAIKELGAFWAVINEPPPGSVKDAEAPMNSPSPHSLPGKRSRRCGVGSRDARSRRHRLRTHPRRGGGRVPRRAATGRIRPDPCGLHAARVRRAVGTRIVRQQLADVPFIFVSGTLGEEVAIDALKMGATDYVFKTRLSRLVPAIHRAMREAGERVELRQQRERLRQLEAELAHMDRVSIVGNSPPRLRMKSTSRFQAL